MRYKPALSLVLSLAAFVGMAAYAAPPPKKIPRPVFENIDPVKTMQGKWIPIMSTSLGFEVTGDEISVIRWMKDRPEYDNLKRVAKGMHITKSSKDVRPEGVYFRYEGEADECYGNRSNGEVFKQPVCIFVFTINATDYSYEERFSGFGIVGVSRYPLDPTRQP